METALYNVEGKRVGEITLPKKVFDVAWNPELVHQVITSMQANQRKGTAHTKDRGEVRGGGRKPWRQKGTGRARHGSIRSPIWAGGGVTHGPRAEKKYEKQIPKKMAKKALYSLLSQKAREQEIIVLDALALPAIKTKEGVALLKRFEKKGRVLVAMPKGEETLARAFRNIPRAEAMPARNLNALDAARPAFIIFSQKSLEDL
jgi:large subunit ribosomal protein L4